MTSDTFKGEESRGGVRWNDILWKSHNGKMYRNIQKRDRWRRRYGGNKMGRDDTKVSKRKDPVGKTL